MRRRCDEHPPGERDGRHDCRPPRRGREMMVRGIGSAAALLLALVAIGLAVVVAVAHFPEGLSVLACGVLAIYSAWYGIRRRGGARTLALAAAALLAAGAVVLIIVEGRALE